MQSLCCPAAVRRSELHKGHWQKCWEGEASEDAEPEELPGIYADMACDGQGKRRAHKPKHKLGLEADLPSVLFLPACTGFVQAVYLLLAVFCRRNKESLADGG